MTPNLDKIFPGTCEKTAKAKEFAQYLMDTTPPGPDLRIAIFYVQQALYSITAE